MKHIFNAIGALSLFFMTFSCMPSQKIRKQDAGDVTLLTYNIRNGTGLDNVKDYKRTAGVITKIEPDIVAVQEVDSATHRSGGVSVLNRLATLTGMIPTFRAAIDYDGGKYGIGILSKEKPLKVDGLPLPGREEKRTVVVVEMKDYVFACVHLSLTEEDRVKSVGLINQLTSKYSKPVFLAGDFNTEPGSPVVKAFSDNWNFLSDTTQLTIPADKPVDCIDYILARKQKGPSFKVIGRGVWADHGTSDHLPVWVRVIIRR